MNPEVENLFLGAAELDPAAQCQYLDRHCADPAVRAEVERLLRFDRGSEEFLQQPMLKLAGELASAPPPEAGRYRLVRPLGHGGMGAVYEGERQDGEVRLRVAVKFLPPDLRSPAMLGRFRQERQILADLSHPNIARLLDAGTTDDGTPYLAMELVAGVPIDRWCEQRSLTPRAVVELFLAVCSAVQYAHQHLVVHRDLKPGNILVSQAGEPKLLDFGIAKLLDEAHRQNPSTLRALTPDYASPEQLEGRPVTVATDVFGLGCVLHKLLAGAPPRGSVRVAGDLGAILRRALEPDPALRYGAVQELSDDLRRYLDRRPVRARPARWSYVAGCFLRRNPWLVAAVAGLTLAAAGGISAAVWEARRAEDRTAQLRTLARDLVLHLQDQLRGIPGTLGVRQSLASAGLDSLEQSAGDARKDPALAAEMAAGYRKISEVQFSDTAASLGDARAAWRSISRAIGILAPLPAGLDHSRTWIRAGEIEAELGRLEESLAHAQRAAAIADALLRTHPGDLVAMEIASAASALAARDCRRLNRLAEAQADITRSISLDRLALARNPSSDDAAARLSSSLGWRGRIEVAQLRIGRAEASAEEAVSVVRDRHAERALLVALSRLGSVTQDANRSLGYLSEAYRIAVRRARSDPEDSRAQFDLRSVATRYGAALLTAGQLDAAGPLLDVSGARALRRRYPESREARLNLAIALGWLAEYRMVRDDRGGAAAARKEAARIEADLLKENRQDADVRFAYADNQAALIRLLGRSERAARACAEVSPIEMPAGEASELSEAYRRLAKACTWTPSR